MDSCPHRSSRGFFETENRGDVCYCLNPLVCDLETRVRRTRSQCMTCPLETRSAPTAEAAPIVIDTLDCIHRGKRSRMAACSCGAKVVKVYECAVHEECVLTWAERSTLTAADKPLAKRKSCDHCRDKQSQRE